MGISFAKWSGTKQNTTGKLVTRWSGQEYVCGETSSNGHCVQINVGVLIVRTSGCQPASFPSYLCPYHLCCPYNKGVMQ